jgi:cytochrome c
MFRYRNKEEMRMRKVLFIFVLVLVASVLVACGGGGGSGQADQVNRGKTVYTDNCASCHDQGVGPVLDKATLSSAFATGADLHAYTSAQMPLNNPGSLSQDQYFDVEAYILQNAGLLPADTVFSADTAANVKLTQ